MVERLFDATCSLWLVDVPTAMLGLASEDHSNLLMMGSSTLLPQNFWVSSTSHCQRRNLAVVLERGKVDGQRFLELSITDTSDPLFYFEQRLDEDAYGKMRAEQQILVPFDAFAEQLAAFLRSAAVVPSPSTMPPKFALCLAMPPMFPDDQSNEGSWAIFQVVETSPFKHIVHLALRVDRLANDAMKRKLAGMALAAQNELTTLKRSLYETRKDADALAQALTAERDALKASLDQLSAAISEDAIPGALEERMARIEAAVHERDSLAAKLQDVWKEVKAKAEEISSLKASNMALRDEIQKLESLRGELSRKRTILEDMERVAGEREERIGALKSELRATRDAKCKLEEQCSELMKQTSHLEARVLEQKTEIARLTEELSAAQAETRVAKGKAKAKAALVSSKEAEIEAIRSALAEERANVNVLTEALPMGKDAIARLESENHELQTRIDKYERVSEWMRRRLGGENEATTAPSFSAAMPKRSTVGSKGETGGTFADLHAMIARLGMVTPGGPLGLDGSHRQTAASFSPVEPSDLPTPPQPTGIGGS